jgi:HAD superfamily hydrolase (TIGR01509 family)
MLKLIILDMDGLIIDSEPFWDIAESQVLTLHGLPHHLYDSSHTTGMRISDTINFWRTQHQLSGDDSEIESMILENISTLIKAEGKLLPGIRDLIVKAKSVGVIICIASSSPKELIKSVIDTFGLAECISEFFSSNDCVHGKPHPEVFMKALEFFDVKPSDSVVLEDSVSGVIAAKSASIKCIAIPSAMQFDDPRFSIADVKCVNANEALNHLMTDFVITNDVAGNKSDIEL